MAGHREIFDTLRREILSGRYYSANRLPSEKMLASRFGASRPTVSRAMLDLKRAGLLVTRRGARATLSRFALNATGALGLVMPGVCYAEIFEPLASRLGRLAERAGFDFVRGEVKSEDARVRAREVRRLAYRFSTEHVSGIFFQPLEFLRDSARANAEAVAFFERAGIPVVLLDYDIVSPPGRSHYDMVGIDNAAAGLAVARHLLAIGSRRIAFLHRPVAAPTVDERMRGVAAAVVEAGCGWTQGRNVLCAEPDNRRAVSRFISRTCPDAIVAGNDIAAERLGHTLRTIGGGAERIRLAGFDDVMAAERAGLVATVHQPLDAIAEVALQTLVSRIRSPSLPARKVLLDAPLVTRFSHG